MCIHIWIYFTLYSILFYLNPLESPIRKDAGSGDVMWRVQTCRCVNTWGDIKFIANTGSLCPTTATNGREELTAKNKQQTESVKMLKRYLQKKKRRENIHSSESEPLTVQLHSQNNSKEKTACGVKQVNTFIKL